MDSSVAPFGRMTSYGSEHITVLILTVVFAVVAVFLARRTSGTGYEHRALRITGWVMLTGARDD